MFQDLVEAEIIYGAIWNDQKTRCYHPEILEKYPDKYLEICKDYLELSGMVQVREVDGFEYDLDALSNHGICGKL